MDNELKITSPSFADGGKIAKKFTGFGENISPQLDIHNLSCDVKTLAVTLDDLDVPMVKEYCHWVVWNISASECIPENLSGNPKDAVQGNAYGKNRYAGPKQPVFIRNRHRYLFRVYGLDCTLNLPVTSDKSALLSAMSGHVLQTGEVLCTYKRGEN